MNMRMKVGHFLRRILPAFENVPRGLFTQAGLDFDNLVDCEVVKIEVIYSLDPIPADHQIEFLLHPQMDEAKVTLGEQSERKAAAAEVLST